MKKKIFALLVAICLMVANLPVIPLVSAEEGATGIAGEVLSVPTTGDTAASGQLDGAALHNTEGQDLALRHEEGESFLVIDKAVATKGGTQTSVAAKFFANGMNAAGLPFEITDSSAIAIRVKFNDNSSEITYNPAAFKVVLAKDGAVSELANTTIDHNNTAMWLDMGDASYTKMYPTDYASNSAVAYQFMGNMDGYMILPLKLFGEGFSAADLKAGFESIQIVPVSTYADDAAAATDGSKYSTYKDRELLVGDIVFVDNAADFVAHKTEGMTKYASGLNDGAYTGQAIRGYRNHYYANYTTDSTSNLSNSQSDIANPTTKASGGYMHMAVIPGGDVAVRVAPNNVARTVFGYTFIDSYDGRNTDNILNANSVLGAERSIIPSNGASMTTGVVMRVYVTGNEGKTINIKPFYSKAFATQGFYTFKSGVNFKFIEAKTGKYRELLSTANGLPIEGNVDGWIYIPGFNGTYWAGGNAIFEGNGLLNGLLGFGAYVNDVSSKEQVVYFGDVDFIKDEQAFYDVHIGCKNDAHVFSNPCDTRCNDCFYTREANHNYPYNCSTECTICGTVREPMGHSFENLEDTICVGCGAEVPKNVVNATVVAPSKTTTNFVTIDESDIIENGTLRGAFVKAATGDKSLLSELTDNGAIAIRIKFKDNSKEITFNPAMFRVLLAAKGGEITEESSALANTVIDHDYTAMWLDMEDSSLTKMYPTDYATDSATGYQFMGNMDGYMIIPIRLFGSKYTAKQLKDYFKYLAIEPVATEDADIPTDGSKYSSYEDRELSVGDVSFIGDAEAFAKSKTEGKTKYLNALGDAYSAQVIRGYRNHYNPKSKWNLSALNNVTTTIANPTTAKDDGYMHMVVLPGGERAIKVMPKSEADVSNGKILFAYSHIDTYTDKNTNNTLVGVAQGTEKSIVNSNPTGDNMGLAMRIVITGNEGKTIKIKPTRMFSGTVDTYYYMKEGLKLNFIESATGKMRTVVNKDSTGIEFTGNVDGWLLIPSHSKSHWNGDAFSGYSIATNLDGFGAYINGLTAGSQQAVYFGDAHYVSAINQETYLRNRVGCVNDEHEFDNACDTTCNACFLTREASHKGKYNCSDICEICGTPIVPLGHTYDGLEDTDCNDCGYVTPRNIKRVSIAKATEEEIKEFIKLVESDMLADGKTKGAVVKATTSDKKNDTADLTDDGAIAIRIKFTDNSKEITFNPAAFKVLLSAQGDKVTEESSALANVTVDHKNTAMWLDLDDGSYTKMYPTDFESDNAANYQFMGSMNGYMIVPLKLFGSNYTAKQIKNYFNYVAIEPIVTEAADIPTDGSKYSSYKDRQLEVGEIVFVGDKDEFVKARTAEKVKYSTIYEDGYSGQMIRGYRNHFALGDAETLYNGQSDINPTTNTKGGYMHMAVIPGGERAIKVGANSGTQAVFGYTFIDTYNDRNVDNTIQTTVPGSSYDIIASNMAGKTTGFAMRVYVTGNEGKTLRIKPFYSKKIGANGYYSLNPGTYEFINNETGKINKLYNDGTGLEFTGNLNGWIIIPDFSNVSWNAGANAFEGDNLLPGLLGFGAYVNNISDKNQVVYFGDVLFLRDADKDFFKTNRRTCEILRKHDFAPEVVVTPPGCTTVQKTKEYCTRCGEIRYTYGESPLGHTWGEPIYFAPTCTSEGYNLYECTYGDCKECEREKVADKLAHGINGTRVITVPAGPHKDGYTYEVCLDCGEAVNPDAITTIPATCQGTETKVVGAVAADCRNEGKTGDTICTTCNTIISHSRVTAKLAHVKKTVNAKAATCSKEGYTGDTVCSKCGDTLAKGKAIAKKAHTYSTVTDKATLSENGYTLKKCSVCGYETSKKTIYYAKTIKLSATEYTYNGEAKKPSVTVKDSKGNTISSSNYTVTYPSGRKNVGKYKVTVKFKGNYTGTKYLYFTINPGKTGIKSLEAYQKAIKVTVTKKTTQVTGYEVQYSKSSKFTSAKTKTITKNTTVSTKLESLSRKTTYYVRVRTYKTVDGKKYYSAWSATKKATTK